MKKNLLSLLIVVLMASLLAACATAVSPSDAYKGESAAQIYQHGKEAMEERNYAEAIKRFEALEVQYPYGDETEQGQLYLIYAYYMKEDYALSASAADRFIRLHPTNPNVDYAYYMRGVANYYQNLGFLERFFSIDLAKRDLAQIKKSYVDFTELTTRFPTSRYAPAAHQYQIYLRNVLADHELHIAEYYYERKAYVAAANRASDVVAHYQGAPAVVDALIVMAKSYHQLKLNKLEQDTLLVLRYNYPNIVVDDSESLPSHTY